MFNIFLFVKENMPNFPKMNYILTYYQTRYKDLIPIPQHSFIQQINSDNIKNCISKTNLKNVLLTKLNENVLSL